jgi:hypothetical protein
MLEGEAFDVEGEATPIWVKTRPDEVVVRAKALAARVPAAMVIVKNCLIGEAPFRRMRPEIAPGTSTD